MLKKPPMRNEGAPDAAQFENRVVPLRTVATILAAIAVFSFIVYVLVF
jgi:hypothetical protein